MLLKKKQQIIMELIRHKDTGLTGSTIAQKTSINQKTVANYLTRLEEERILISQTQGKNKIYHLHLENKPIITNFISAIEHFRTIECYKKNALIKEIAQKLTQTTTGSIVLFGSYAKQKQKKDSDIDIYILGTADEMAIEKIANRYRVMINPKHYPTFQHDILTQEVIENHIIIKNVEQFVEAMLYG